MTGSEVEPQSEDKSDETEIEMDSAPQEAAKELGEKEASSSKKREPIQCLADLLRLVYSGRRTRIVPDKKEINAMREAADNGLTEKDVLLELASTDRNLGKTLDLLFICEEKFTLPKLVQQTREFIREILLRHPAFLKAGLANVLLGGEGAMLDIDAVAALAAVDHRELQWADDQEALKKPESDQSRLNALGCLLMWLRSADHLSFDRVQRLMDINIWQPASKELKTELVKLRALLNSKEPGSLAIARESLIKELNAIYKDSEAAKSAEQKAVAGLHAARQRIEELERVMDKSVEAQKILEKRCKKLELEHGDTLAHKQDDYEKLRARMQRRLKAELELLDVGLGALRRDPPKVHVMIDHAERAIDGLKQEMERLRDNE